MSTYPYPNAEAVFYEQYRVSRRDEVIGVLLALFLGGFGVHHFYLGRTGLGILYCCFFWTPLPWFFGFIECFFMPARVREFNAIQAASIAASLGIVPPQSVSQPWTSVQPAVVQALVACPRCQTANPPGSRFCGACGSVIG